MKPFIAPVSPVELGSGVPYLSGAGTGPWALDRCAGCQIHRHLRDSDRAQSSSSHDVSIAVSHVCYSSWYTSAQTRPPLYSSESSEPRMVCCAGLGVRARFSCASLAGDAGFR